jgi:hypothetical protein
MPTNKQRKEVASNKENIATKYEEVTNTPIKATKYEKHTNIRNRK